MKNKTFGQDTYFLIQRNRNDDNNKNYNNEDDSINNIKDNKNLVYYRNKAWKFGEVN